MPEWDLAVGNLKKRCSVSCCSSCSSSTSLSAFFTVVPRPVPRPSGRPGRRRRGRRGPDPSLLYLNIATPSSRLRRTLAGVGRLRCNPIWVWHRLRPSSLADSDRLRGRCGSQRRRHDRGRRRGAGLRRRRLGEVGRRAGCHPPAQPKGQTFPSQRAGSRATGGGSDRAASRKRSRRRWGRRRDRRRRRRGKNQTTPLSSSSRLGKGSESGCVKRPRNRMEKDDVGLVRRKTVSSPVRPPAPLPPSLSFFPFSLSSWSLIPLHPLRAKNPSQNPNRRRRRRR